MTSLQKKLNGFKNELTCVCREVWHYKRPPNTKPPFLVWAEDGEGEYSMIADNHKVEQSIHMYIDYFTKEEFDPAVDEIQDILNAYGSEWRLNDIQYEEDVNLIHYTWEHTM